MSEQVFDDRVCKLGEGPLWHPQQAQLYWFDILGKRLLTRNGDEAGEWQFSEHVSAAGWVDTDVLLIASETGLFRFDLKTGVRTAIVALEVDNPVTRSNDGRADPWGGFWIGTMGKHAEPQAGAIYRYYRGELRRLYPDISVSNSICFAPDKSCAYFSDTHTRKIMRQTLEPTTGWPVGDAAVFIDLGQEKLNPDGAVVDASGVLWVAQWGASQVAAYGPDGKLQKSVPFPALQTSCPAFGGPDLSTLFCTSADVGLPAETRQTQPTNGMTFLAPGIARGLPEYQVIL